MLSRKYQFQWIGHAFFSGPRRLNRQNRTIFDNFRPWFVCDVSLSYFLLRRDVTVFDVTSRCLWRHLIVALSNSCWQQSQWQRLFALEKFFGKGRMPGAVIITRSLIVGHPLWLLPIYLTTMNGPQRTACLAKGYTINRYSTFRHG